jgi:hypothetical protein
MSAVSVIARPPVLEGADSPPSDGRFRALVGERAWPELPPAVRRRFSKRLAPGTLALYRGTVVATELSRTGRILAFLARAIGAPLPLENGATGPAVVAVAEDARAGGQIWTRSYARSGRFPQVVHSMKRFRGPTGLEEHVGCGLGMTLLVTVEDRALVFHSTGYFLEWGRWRAKLPHWLTPGLMTITHRQEDADGRFSFRLTLDHPRLGRLLHQLALFEDA